MYCLEHEVEAETASDLLAGDLVHQCVVNKEAVAEGSSSNMFGTSASASCGRSPRGTEPYADGDVASGVLSMAGVGADVLSAVRVTA